MASKSDNTVQINIASIPLNQTAGKFARNMENIAEGMYWGAVVARADVVCFPEDTVMTLDAQDYRYWESYCNEALANLYRAAELSTDYPETLFNIGVPILQYDPEREANPGDPLYNHKHKVINATAWIKCGKVLGFVVKETSADRFTEDELRTQLSGLEDFGVVEFTPTYTVKDDATGETRVVTEEPTLLGDVVVELRQGDKCVKFINITCEDGWFGINDDGSLNDHEFQGNKLLRWSRKAMDQAEANAQNPLERAIALVGKCKRRLEGAMRVLVGQEPVEETRRYVTPEESHAAMSDVVVVNPSDSKPGWNRSPARWGMVVAHSLYAGASVYTNRLGIAGESVTAQGDSYIAQNGEMVHWGERQSYRHVVGNNHVVELQCRPDIKLAHVSVPFQFKDHSKTKEHGEKAAWEDGPNRELEEYVRNSCLWIRDYLAKSKQQGFVVFVSGGHDSGLGAAKVAMSIEVGCRQLGVEGFLNEKDFGHLKYRQEVLDVLAEQGEKAAIALLKQRMLTCVTMPSKNNSGDTQEAARFLVEGGDIELLDIAAITTADQDGRLRAAMERGWELLKGKGYETREERETLVDLVQCMDAVRCDGADASELWLEAQRLHKAVEALRALGNADAAAIAEVLESATLTRVEHAEGIGGKFMSIDINDIFLQFKERFETATTEQRRKLNEMLGEEVTPDILKGWIDGMRALDWNDKTDNLTLQNIQARVRLVMGWIVANDENKSPCTTSTASEALDNMSTAVGDTHMGAVNLLGGVLKSVGMQVNRFLTEEGLMGIGPIRSLIKIAYHYPSPELEPLDEKGNIKKYSIATQGADYDQIDAIYRELVYNRQSPLQTYEKLKNHEAFANDDAAEQCVDICNKILTRVSRFGAGQYKRYMSVVSPYYGVNVDPHRSERVAILADHFRSFAGELKLQALDDVLRIRDGIGLHEILAGEPVHLWASLSEVFQNKLFYTSVDDLYAMAKEHGTLVHALLTSEEQASSRHIVRLAEKKIEAEQNETQTTRATA